MPEIHFHFHMVTRTLDTVVDVHKLIEHVVLGIFITFVHSAVLPARWPACLYAATFVRRVALPIAIFCHRGRKIPRHVTDVPPS